MNNPSLNNFGSADGQRSFWKRWGWLVILVILVILAGGWYLAGIFITPERAPFTTSITTTSSGNKAAIVPADAPYPRPTGKVYDYTQAKSHVNENAGIRGTVTKVYDSAKVTFLDFCGNSKTVCPFSGVIFSNDISKFPDVSQYKGKTVIISGIIKVYNGKAEIVLSDPRQIWLEK
jgi:hypothetical protein